MDDKRRDWQLLRKYIDSQSQPAFAELTRRYLGLVFSTALRELGDRAEAEDVTQAVFLILARKAHTFRPNVILAAWLFDTCKFAAKHARRSEKRRQLRERKVAMEMRQSAGQDQDAEIQNIGLNEAISGLSPADRQAVLLRFVCGYSFAETGEAFGISENTARMRIDRALERLRRALTKAGMGLSVVAIADALQPHAAQAASPGLESRIAELVLPHSATILAGIPAHAIAQGVLKSMKIMQIKIAAAVTLGVALAGGAAYHGIAGPPPLPATLPISAGQLPTTSAEDLTGTSPIVGRKFDNILQIIKSNDDRMRQGTIAYTSQQSNLQLRAQSLEQLVAERRKQLEAQGEFERNVDIEIKQFKSDTLGAIQIDGELTDCVLIYARDHRFARDTTPAADVSRALHFIYDGQDQLLHSPNSTSATLFRGKPSEVQPVYALFGMLYPGPSYTMGRGLSSLTKISMRTAGPYLRLSGKAADGTDIIAMLDPKHGYVANRIVRKNKNSLISITTLGKPIKTGPGIWVASSADSNAQSFDGKPLIHSHFELKKASFAAPDDSAFVIKLQPGWAVLDNRLGKQLLVTVPGSVTLTKEELLPLTQNKMAEQADFTRREAEYQRSR